MKTLLAALIALLPTQSFAAKIACHSFIHETNRNFQIIDNTTSISITDGKEITKYPVAIINVFGQPTSAAYYEEGGETKIYPYRYIIEANGRYALIFNSAIFYPTCETRMANN